MPELDPIKDAEQILTSLEEEILERLQATEGYADGPQMNSAVGRLTYIDAYQQQQVALHARRKMESEEVKGPPLPPRSVLTSNHTIAIMLV